MKEFTSVNEGIYKCKKVIYMCKKVIYKRKWRILLEQMKEFTSVKEGIYKCKWSNLQVN